MAKIINIVDCNIKEFAITYQQDQWNISVVYSLVADDGIELNPKREQIKDIDLNTTQKNYLNNILNVLTSKIKAKEGI